MVSDQIEASRARRSPAPVTVRPPAIRHSHCRFRLAAIAEVGGNKLKPQILKFCQLFCFSDEIETF
jgi:hypothetical protein